MLYLAQVPLSIVVFIGLIMLAGIVVNNAIVLIDYINLLIKRKREEMGIDSMYSMTVDDIKGAIIEWITNI